MKPRDQWGPADEMAHYFIWSVVIVAAVIGVLFAIGALQDYFHS